MGRTRKLQAGLTQRDSSLFVGEYGHLFYDNDTGLIRRSDGRTPGGLSIAVNTNIVTTESIIPSTDNVYGIGTNLLRWNHLHIGDGGIYFDGNQTTGSQTVAYIPGAITTNLVPAADNGVDLGNTNHRFANLYLGYQGLFLADSSTDANVNITVNSGTMYINGAENLRLGNLAIRDTTLTSANSTLDISIGNTNDTGFFYVKRKAQFDNVTWSDTEAMVSINGSGTTDPDTIFPDTLVQTTGRPGKNSRIIQRAYGSTSTQSGTNAYAVWGSYAARGTIAAPQALTQNDILARISANGYGTSTWGSGGARVEFVALEDFTDSAKGTKINFWTTPAGQITSQNVASINSNGLVANSVEFTGTGRTQSDAGIPVTAKGVFSATYVATLGIDGKLDSSQIPSNLSGALVFKGGWDASANSPTLVNGSGTDGYEYSISVQGTRSLGTQTGTVTYEPGGFVIYGAGVWNYTPPFNNITYVTGTVGSHIRVNNNYGTQETGVIALSTDATPTASTSTIVSRDASGNFSANVISANLTGNVTGNVTGSSGSTTGNAATASKLFSPTTINGVNFDGSSPVTVHIAGAGISINGTTVTNIGVVSTATLMANAVYAYSFNTGTLVTNATAVTNAVQAAITSVGTLTGLTVGGNFVTTGTIRYNVAYNNSSTTQLSSKSTSVTCNGRTGQIITSNAALNKGASVEFTVFNNYITANTDVVILNIASGATVGYAISVNNVSSTGTFQVSLHNSDSTAGGANASDALTINFAVLKVS